jgi:hypothetical protein
VHRAVGTELFDQAAVGLVNPDQRGVVGVRAVL